MEPLRAISARTAASRLTVCLLSAACCLLVAGCQNGRRMQADLYQRELRLQEDEIYRLEDYIEEYQGIIAGYRCEIDDLKRELAEAQSERRSGAPSARSDSVQLSPRKKNETSLLTTPEPTDFDPPSSEPLPPGDITPTEEAPAFKPGATAAPLKAEPLEEAPAFEGAAIEAGRASQIAEAPREPALLQPISATLPAKQLPEETPPKPYPNAVAKRSPAVEPAPELVGDPTLRVTAEAIDDASQTISVVVESQQAEYLRRFTGTVSVMLTDPAEDNRSKRIARWDFTEAEVREAIQSDTAGLRLTIALPVETPTDRPLRLIENESLADAGPLHRLPSAEAGGAVVRSESSGWRTPTAAERRVDSAVTPASYEAW